MPAFKYALLSVAAVLAAVAPAWTQSYSPPRAADGKPDFEGIWQADNTAAYDLEDHPARLGLPAGRGVVVEGEIPYRPEAKAQKEKNFENRATADPVSRCLLPGVPRANYMPFPLQIFQTSQYVAILYEYMHAYRLIPLDGNEHPSEGNFWMGDSRGSWKGDTLVVDVTNNSALTWFDASGNFHSGALHVVERYTRTGPDSMRYEATIEDPGVFTKPWRISMPLFRRTEKDAQLLEYDCHADGASSK